MGEADSELVGVAHFALHSPASRPPVGSDASGGSMRYAQLLAPFDRGQQPPSAFCTDLPRYRGRVSWAETPSREAVAGFRQPYHQALEQRDLYVGCG
jgi:hypothetical protein